MAYLIEKKLVVLNIEIYKYYEMYVYSAEHECMKLTYELHR